MVRRPASAAPAAFAEEDEFVLDPERARNFVRRIGDNRRGTSSSANRDRRHRPPSRGNAIEDAERIRLFIVDGSNGDERHGFVVEPTANFKALFNEYAEKRGVSLLSLRFSYHGKSLFLSSVGNKSPSDLNIRDRDVIVVYDTTTNNETSRDSETSASRTCRPSEKVKKKKSSPKRAKKGKKKQAPARQETVTMEEYKARHSKRLSKLHEEAEPRLKEIRKRLNSLGLERQLPKRRRRKEKKPDGASADLSCLPTPGVGGKAGKSHFLVQVGEVQHLYRTTKRCGPYSASNTLDLHGHTREEALAKLDEQLKVWVDTAMRGSYPFVITAKIVCGCGNQVIAETVEKWIKSTKNVGNAPNQIR